MPCKLREGTGASRCTPCRHCPPTTRSSTAGSRTGTGTAGGTHQVPERCASPQPLTPCRGTRPGAPEPARPQCPGAQVSRGRGAMRGQLCSGKVPGVTPPAQPRDTGTTRERPAHGRDLPSGRAASSPSLTARDGAAAWDPPHGSQPIPGPCAESCGPAPCLPPSRATRTPLMGTTRSLLPHHAGGSRGTLTAGQGAWQRAGLPAVPWGPQRGQPLCLGVPSARAAPARVSLGVGNGELCRLGQAPAELGHTGHVPTERCWGTQQSWAAWGRARGRCQPRCPGGCLL